MRYKQERNGFNKPLGYVNDTRQSKSKARSRKHQIICYNPPYFINVKINIGKVFFHLSKKHFPKNSILYKIFNHNTIKICKSTMRNISAIISSHSKSLLAEVICCNCR